MHIPVTRLPIPPLRVHSCADQAGLTRYFRIPIVCSSQICGGLFALPIQFTHFCRVCRCYRISQYSRAARGDRHCHCIDGPRERDRRQWMDTRADSIGAKGCALQPWRDRSWRGACCMRHGWFAVASCMASTVRQPADRSEVVARKGTHSNRMGFLPRVPLG
jgi:hypothetical protein